MRKGRGPAPDEREARANPGCHLPPPLPSPTVVKDHRGREWTLGKPLGQGGFGAIYLTQPGNHRQVDSEAEYVVKVEPHDNGPLFVEVHALLALGRQKSMISWRPRYDGKPEGWVGMPTYHAHGSFHFNDIKLRFLVLDRFGSDLEKVFKGGEEPFPLATVFNIGYQVLNTLEYIHSYSYCHNDIKAANILVNSGGADVFLVDFGLACKFRDTHGFHKDGTPDDRRAHEGTLEYASRDAHDGVHSRRGDLESLGLCLVHWAGGRLPWMHLLKGNPEDVQAAKEKFLGPRAISSFLNAAFHPSPPPKAIVQFWEEVTNLGFIDEPNYSRLRQFFWDGLQSSGSRPHEKLKFSGKILRVVSRRSHLEKVEVQPDDGGRKTRSRDEADSCKEDSNPDSWQFEDLSDPRAIMREGSKSKAEEAMARVEPGKDEDFARRQAESLQNPTPEMTRIMKMLEERERIRESLNWKEQLQELQKRSRANFEEVEAKSTTPQMEEVMALRAVRLAASPNTPETSEEEDRIGDQEEAMEVAEEVKVVRFAADNQVGKENRVAKTRAKKSFKELDGGRQLRSRRKTLENLQSRPNTRSVLKEVPVQGKGFKPGRRRRKTLGDLDQEEMVKPASTPLDLAAFRTPPRVARSTRASMAASHSKHFDSSSTSPTSDESSDGGSRPHSSASCSSTPELGKEEGSSDAEREKQAGGRTPPSSTSSRRRRPSSRAGDHGQDDRHQRSEEKRSNLAGASRTGRKVSVARSRRTPGEKYEECKVCSKELNVKSMKRHLEEIHKRILPDASIRGSTGFTPAVKKTRRCRSQAEEQNQTKGKQRGAEDKTEENKVGQGKDCVEETRRGRRSRGGLKGEKRMEEVNQRFARVSVSEESPGRSHHVGSPDHNAVTERRLRAVISSFKRGLTLE